MLLRESAAGPTGSGMMLGMLGVALAWAVQKPFGLVALWWDRRHGISHVGYRVWLPGALLTLAVSFTIVCLTLLILMSLARFLGERWWIPGAAVITVIAFAFALVSPWWRGLTHRRIRRWSRPTIASQRSKA